MTAELVLRPYDLPNILLIVGRLAGGARNLLGRGLRGISNVAGRAAARLGAGRSRGT